VMTDPDMILTSSRLSQLDDKDDEFRLACLGKEVRITFKEPDASTVLCQARGVGLVWMSTFSLTDLPNRSKGRLLESIFPDLDSEVVSKEVSQQVKYLKSAWDYRPDRKYARRAVAWNSRCSVFRQAYPAASCKGPCCFANLFLSRAGHVDRIGLSAPCIYRLPRRTRLWLRLCIYRNRDTVFLVSFSKVKGIRNLVDPQGCLGENKNKKKEEKKNKRMPEKCVDGYALLGREPEPCVRWDPRCQRWRVLTRHNFGLFKHRGRKCLADSVRAAFTEALAKKDELQRRKKISSAQEW